MALTTEQLVEMVDEVVSVCGGHCSASPSDHLRCVAYLVWEVRRFENAHPPVEGLERVDALRVMQVHTGVYKRMPHVFDAGVKAGIAEARAAAEAREKSGGEG